MGSLQASSATTTAGESISETEKGQGNEEWAKNGTLLLLTSPFAGTTLQFSGPSHDQTPSKSGDEHRPHVMTEADSSTARARNTLYDAPNAIALRYRLGHNPEGDHPPPHQRPCKHPSPVLQATRRDVQYFIFVDLPLFSFRVELWQDSTVHILVVTAM